MSETVGIVYEVEGTAEAAAAVGVLTGAVAEVGPATESASDNLDRFAAVAQESTQQAIQFGQRLQAAASAVQSLSSVLGGGGEAAALVGRVTQTSVAFAQLGGILGPGGALVGGIVGALIPAWQSFMSALEPVAPALETVTRATDTNTASLLQQASAADTAAASLRSFLESLDPSNVQNRIANNGEQIRALSDELAGLGRGTLEQLNRRQEIEAEIGRLTRQAAELGDEVVSLSGGRGGRSGSRGARGTPSDPDADKFNDAVAFARGLARGPQINGSDVDERAVTRSGQQTAGGGPDAQRRAEIATQQLAIQALTARRALEDKSHDERMRHQREYLASIQDELGALGAAGEKLGGVFSTAFQAAVQGQQDFGEAMREGVKQLLLQYGTQMVAEGVGALFTGIGNAIMNPPAAAAKLAEGAGKIALGVGLGAAGAAIPSSAGAAPAAPRGGGGFDSGNGKAPAPLVINMNAPTVIGGTNAEWGRAAEASIRVAQRRYGRAAA